ILFITVVFNRLK
uniref:Uncharacterized protein n=1 Tax=Amphimedon queenslandica TaxID=400682 RepID=A0A1X7VRA2_AMPQE